VGRNVWTRNIGVYRPEVKVGDARHGPQPGISSLVRMPPGVDMLEQNGGTS
jgi:hypothetical protein